MKSALIALAIITSSFALAQAQAPVPAPGPEQPAPGPIPAPLPGDPGPGPGPGPADGAQEALTALVHLFGQTPAGGIIRGDRQAFPQCKVFVNYLMDRGPAPGVRIGVEQWNYALIFPQLIIRRDFVASEVVGSPLLQGTISPTGGFTLHVRHSTLHVQRERDGSVTVGIDGAICNERGAIPF